MRGKHYKDFWRNMWLFASIFLCVALIVIFFFLSFMVNNEQVRIQRDYMGSAQRYASKIDNRLYDISALMKNIANITWVKKFSSSSYVFERDFTVSRRIEYQQELWRYMSIDSAISEIALYKEEVGAILSPKGLFSRLEYRRYLEDRYDFPVDTLLEDVSPKNRIYDFAQAEYNTMKQKYIVINYNLEEEKQLPLRMVLILNRDIFNQGMKQLGGEELLGIEVLNQSKERFFYTSHDIPEGYKVEINSKEFPLYYHFTFSQPSDFFYWQMSVFTPIFITVVLGAVIIVLFLSCLLSWCSIRPLKNFVKKIRSTGIKECETKFIGWEDIANSYISLYMNKQALWDSMNENYQLARKYALYLVLLGEERFVERCEEYFDMLGIPFTQEQIYSVWIITQDAPCLEGMNIEELLTELYPEVESLEKIQLSPEQVVIIIGMLPGVSTPDSLELASHFKYRIMKLQNALLGVEVEATSEPGIAGISKAYFKLRCQKEEISKKILCGQQIVDYINLHYSEAEISLKDLGYRWGLSVSAVSQLCKETMGIGFQAYLMSLRMTKAKELLMESDKSLMEIALMVGYTSEYSFRRAFKKNENCRIQDWIKENCKNQNSDWEENP